MNKAVLLCFCLCIFSLQATTSYQIKNDNDCTASFVAKNYADAFIECNALAKEDNGEANFITALLYAKGLGVSKNKDQALIYLKQADSLGHAEASFNLATAYQMGKIIGVNLEQSKRLAFEYYQKSARAGSRHGQRKLAALLSDENSLRYRPEKAAKWLSEAMSQGDLKAQLRLGTLYLKGTGVKQNQQRGIELIKDAADAGLDIAQFIYATLIYQSEPDLGRVYFEKAADQNYGYAAHNLASMYFNGEHVTQDKTIADKYARLAIANGVLQSQLFLLANNTKYTSDLITIPTEASKVTPEQSNREKGQENLSGFALQFGVFSSLQYAQKLASIVDAPVVRRDEKYVVVEFGFSSYKKALTKAKDLTQELGIAMPYVRSASDFSNATPE